MISLAAANIPFVYFSGKACILVLITSSNKNHILKLNYLMNELSLQQGPIGVVIPWENAAHVPPARKNRQSNMLIQSFGALPPRTVKTCDFRETLSSSPFADGDSNLCDAPKELFPITFKMLKAKIATTNWIAIMLDEWNINLIWNNGRNLYRLVNKNRWFEAYTVKSSV